MFSIKILTFNSEETLKKTLDSTRSFPEVLIYDTGSKDSTLNIAKGYPNVRIISGPFEGFGKTHNTASQYASYDWILSLDSDEVLSQELIEELHRFTPEENTVYSLQRSNFLHGKQIKWCGGWYPDWVVRVYNRNTTRFTNDEVHETVITTGQKVIPFSGPVLHTPYRKISDFLSKMQMYSTLFAEQHKHQKKSSLGKAILHGLSAFLKSYFCKRGFLGGSEGFIISLYNGQTTFYKYLKLWEINLK
jgi:glycosyltransferase involved in cell wall biosynthesis